MTEIVSDIAVFVLKRDAKLQLTNCDGRGRGWLGVVDKRLVTESRPKLETVNK